MLIWRLFNYVFSILFSYFTKVEKSFSELSTWQNIWIKITFSYINFSLLFKKNNFFLFFIKSCLFPKLFLFFKLIALIRFSSKTIFIEIFKFQFTQLFFKNFVSINWWLINVAEINDFIDTCGRSRHRNFAFEFWLFRGFFLLSNISKYPTWNPAY